MNPQSTSQCAMVYVNSADSGTISRYQLDLQQGQLRYLDAVETGKNVAPLASSPDKTHLYAAVRSKPFKVVSYAIETQTGEQQGKLTKLASAPLAASMSYITTDKANKWLFATSYDEHLLTISPINLDGVIIAEAMHRYPTPSHAHCVVVHPNNHLIYATSLGEDKILQYRLNPVNGDLTPIANGFVDAPKFSGPRHITLSPCGQRLYVVTEFTHVVCCYDIDSETGILTQFQIEDSFPAEHYHLVAGKLGGITAPKGYAAIWGADIKITPNGRFIYTSERSSNTVSLYHVDAQTGKLHYVSSTFVEKQPRGIAIDPTGQFLIVSGQLDNKIGLYRIEPQNGTLTRTSEAPISLNASWIEVVIF